MSSHEERNKTYLVWCDIEAIENVHKNVCDIIPAVRSWNMLKADLVRLELPLVLVIGVDRNTVLRDGYERVANLLCVYVEGEGLLSGHVLHRLVVSHVEYRSRDC